VQNRAKHGPEPIILDWFAQATTGNVKIEFSVRAQPIVPERNKAEPSCHARAK